MLLFVSSQASMSMASGGLPCPSHAFPHAPRSGPCPSLACHFPTHQPLSLSCAPFPHTYQPLSLSCAPFPHTSAPVPLLRAVSPHISPCPSLACQFFPTLSSLSLSCTSCPVPLCSSPPLARARPTLRSPLAGLVLLRRLPWSRRSLTLSG